MTLSERFEDLAARLTMSDESGHIKVVQWNITGEESGAWAFEVGNGAARLIPGGVEEPDTTITTSDDTWIAIADGKQDPMKAFMLGKVTVTGNMTLALQVTQLFQTAEPAS